MGNKKNRPTMDRLYMSQKFIPTTVDWHPNYPEDHCCIQLLVIRQWTFQKGETIWGSVRAFGEDDHESQTYFDFESVEQASAWFQEASEWLTNLSIVTGYNVDKTCPRPRTRLSVGSTKVSSKCV